MYAIDQKPNLGTVRMKYENAEPPISLMWHVCMGFPDQHMIPLLSEMASIQSYPIIHASFETVKATMRNEPSEPGFEPWFEVRTFWVRFGFDPKPGILRVWVRVWVRK